MPLLKLFNTETREKEEIFPLKDNTIRMYTCGPTVYNFAHIGNFRTYVFEDLLRRVLHFFGFSVTQVMNITDIDDKTLRGAIAKKISLKEYTDPFTKAFFEDLETLNIESAEHYPEATQYIDRMIYIILELFKKRFAYIGADGSIYFSIKRFPSYGRLSHLKLEMLKQGASQRVSADEYDKENAADFVLWKSYDPERDGEIFWESPFGKGRPGWHIECSAMALALLGETIDLHCGGVDNIFPHHENEIAQSEAFTGKRFVNHWSHVEHLIVDGKKMSKSLGNFYTLRDLLAKGYTGKEVRFLLLQTHHRTQLNFTFQSLEASRASLARLSDFIERLREIKEKRAFKDFDVLLFDVMENFSKALADDINISAALATLFDFVRKVNSLCDRNQIGKEQAEAVLIFLKRIDRVLGILPLEAREGAFPPEIYALLEKRNEARRLKNFTLSDEIRKELLNQGYLIEDTPEGARLKKLL